MAMTFEARRGANAALALNVVAMGRLNSAVSGRWVTGTRNVCAIASVLVNRIGTNAPKARRGGAKVVV